MTDTDIRLAEEAIGIEAMVTDYVRQRANDARRKLNLKSRNYDGVPVGGMSIAPVYP